MGGIEAQSGFYYQNVVGALRALDLIELGSPLVSVSFDNPNKAESIDDIVAEGVGFAEFTQVKWAEDGDSTFTLANLTFDRRIQFEVAASKNRGRLSSDPDSRWHQAGHPLLDEEGGDERSSGQRIPQEPGLVHYGVPDTISPRPTE